VGGSTGLVLLIIIGCFINGNSNFVVTIQHTTKVNQSQWFAKEIDWVRDIQIENRSGLQWPL